MEAVNVMSMENVCASPSARLARRASICRASSLSRPFPNVVTGPFRMPKQAFPEPFNRRPNNEMPRFKYRATSILRCQPRGIVLKLIEHVVNRRDALDDSIDTNVPLYQQLPKAKSLQEGIIVYRPQIRHVFQQVDCVEDSIGHTLCSPRAHRLHASFCYSLDVFPRCGKNHRPRHERTSS